MSVNPVSRGAKYIKKPHFCDPFNGENCMVRTLLYTIPVLQKLR